MYKKRGDDGTEEVSFTYYPFGEERGSAVQNDDSFATYYWDKTTGIDYADQRYYSASIGRFLTPDPYHEDVQSGGPQNTTSSLKVTNVQKTGAAYAAVARRVQELLQNIDSDCRRFLESVGNKLGEYVADLLSNDLLEVADSSQNVAAFTNTAGTDLTSVEAAIVVNAGGAFFSSACVVNRKRIAGGTPRAQAFILLHEFAHALDAKGFQADFNDRGAGNQNDALIHQDCSKTLGRF